MLARIEPTDKVSRMPFILKRIVRRFHEKPITSQAYSVTELYPAVETTGKPVFFIEDNLSNLISYISSSNADLETRRLMGRECYHPPTLAYELRDVRMEGPFLAAGLRYLKHKALHETADRTDHGFIADALFSGNALSGLEFGHWLRDTLVSELHGADIGLPPVALARDPWQHEPGYRAMAHLPCLYPYKARIGRMILLDDRGYNAHWARRLGLLRQRLRAGAQGLPGQPGGALVYLDRGSGARMRDPTNRDAVRDALEAIGFRTVVPTGLTVDEIGLALRDATLAVSVEGSHLNHLHCFAPEGLTLVTLQDPRRFSLHHKRVIDCYDGRLGVVVGEPDPEQADRYRIDIADLMRVLDLVRRLPA